MEIYKLSFITFFFCMTCTSWSCRKEKDQLPKTTQEGKNTFGCKVNGKVFIAKDAITFPVLKALYTYYDTSDSSLHINAGEPPNEEENGFKRVITFDIEDLKIGDNLLNESNKAEVDLLEHDQPDQYFE